MMVSILFLDFCNHPAHERAEMDLSVGYVSGFGLSVTVEHGMACIQQFEEGALTLWAQAPVLRIFITTGSTAWQAWKIKIRNSIPDADLTARQSDNTIVPSLEQPTSILTELVWDITLPLNDMITLELASPDAFSNDTYRFAYVSDLHYGTQNVQDVFVQLNQDSSIRFVVSGGDITQEGRGADFAGMQQAMQTLRFPLFSTVGNHDVGTDEGAWHRIFGKFNHHFSFKGVYFTLVDSGSATIEPMVYGWLDSWLGAGYHGVHIFVTHYPPLDPIGLRGGGFSSRKEAAKLLAKLGRGAVDMTCYGHIHSYYSFSNAGIPAYISGGGGGNVQELWDGIERHYLAVDVVPGSGISSVSVVRVD